MIDRAPGAPTGPAAVDVRGWGWRHPGRRDWAVRGLDLRIEAGERVLLLGPSGAGKSTLLLGLAGLLDRSGGGEAEGSITVDGVAAAAARDRIGIVFQEPENQIVMGRAGDDVAFGLENRCVPTTEIWLRVDAALASVGFPYPRDRPTTQLSGGELQRLALGAVLALRPDLLLLDEPTANLDPEGAARFVDALRHAVGDAGPTVILVEHRLDELLPLVTRVVALDAGGRMLADGDPLDVFATHARQLSEAGVWLPGWRVASPRRPRIEPTTMLLADQAGYRYPDAARPAVLHADVQVRAGEALAMVGPNGSGKTTLAMLLAGLLRPTSGEVLSSEALAPGRGREPIWRWSAGELSRHVGMVFQNPEHQFLTRRVSDELALGPRRLGLPPLEVRQRVTELLERLGLERLAGANPFTLSGGEKRRLSVGTALASAPAVLVLDEPTFGQDARTWLALLGLLAGLRESGRAIAFATHDGEFTRVLADRTLHLAPLRDPMLEAAKGGR